MSTTIICVGKSMIPPPGKYDSAAFDTAVNEIMNSACPPYEGRKYSAGNKTVLIGEGIPALDTVEKILLPCAWTVDPLLNEIPLRSCADSEDSFTVRQWMRKAAAQRKRGNPRQQESLADAKLRADKLIEKLSREDFILITYPEFLSVLLKRLRINNFVVQRSGYIKIQPMERFLVSRKEDHCGGCQHNCFLRNPGCGVGCDKAARKGIPYKK